jgi:hypothetical protein
MKLFRETIRVILEDKWGDYEEMATKIDRSLIDDAERAIADFVGADASKDIESGLMNSNWLEDAYSDSPSERGLKIRQQLEQSIAPLKDRLREVYGRFVPLYRAQHPYPKGSKARHTLSMSQDIEFVEFWMHGRKPRKRYILKIYMENGDGWIGWQDIFHTNPPKQVVYSRKEAEKAARSLVQQEFEAFQRYIDEAEYLDGATIDDFVISYEEDESSYEEAKQKRAGKDGDVPGKLMHVLVPIDDIIWVTNRANQREFIVKNKEYTSLSFKSKKVAH